MGKSTPSTTYKPFAFRNTSKSNYRFNSRATYCDIILFLQESIVSTPVKDVPALKEGEEKESLETIKNAITTSTTDSEIEHQKSLIISENKNQEEIPTDNDGSLKNQTNDSETSNETKTNDEITTVDGQEILEDKNKQENCVKLCDNQNLESPNEIKIDDLELTNTNKMNDNSELAKDSAIDTLDLTMNNEDDIIEKLNEIKNSDLKPLNVTEDEKIILNLNISEEIKILDNAVTKNIHQDDDSETKKYLQVNGEISPVNDDDTNHNFDEIVENHLESNDIDTETKNIEMQNSLNTLLSESVQVETSEKEDDNKSPLIINLTPNEDVKEKANESLVNQDSISISSDSETIVNSECLQNEINGDNLENSEHKAGVQPISVITIQTCDIVDSDCSEAYLTPNELNDTPKKILERCNSNANDHIVNDDVVLQSNPSMESIDDVQNPSNNTSESIIELKENKENVIKVEDNLDADEKDNDVKKVEELVDKIEKNINHSIETVKTIENCKELQALSESNLEIIHQANEECITINNEGMFKKLIHKKIGLKYVNVKFKYI